VGVQDSVPVIPAKSLVAKMAARSAPFGMESEPSAFSTATLVSAANRMFVASYAWAWKTLSGDPPNLVFRFSRKPA
jgi:hypothetical protein